MHCQGDYANLYVRTRVQANLDHCALNDPTGLGSPDVNLKELTARLFRPVYVGEFYEVRPRHWWSRKDRKAARLALTVAEHQWRENRVGIYAFLNATANAKPGETHVLDWYLKP